MSISENINIINSLDSLPLEIRRELGKGYYNLPNSWRLHIKNNLNKFTDKKTVAELIPSELILSSDINDEYTNKRLNEIFYKESVSLSEFRKIVKDLYDVASNTRDFYVPKGYITDFLKYKSSSLYIALNIILNATDNDIFDLADTESSHYIYRILNNIKNVHKLIRESTSSFNEFDFSLVREYAALVTLFFDAVGLESNKADNLSSLFTTYSGFSNTISNYVDCYVEDRLSNVEENFDDITGDVLDNLNEEKPKLVENINNVDSFSTDTEINGFLFFGDGILNTLKERYYNDPSRYRLEVTKLANKCFDLTPEYLGYHGIKKSNDINFVLTEDDVMTIRDTKDLNVMMIYRGNTIRYVGSLKKDSSMIFVFFTMPNDAPNAIFGFNIGDNKKDEYNYLTIDKFPDVNLSFRYNFDNLNY